MFIVVLCLFFGGFAVSQGKGLSKAVTKPQSRQGPEISHIILLVLKKIKKNCGCLFNLT